MPDYARRTTLEAVKGLSGDQLDAVIMAQANTIGLLLAHMMHVGETYQAVTFRGAQPSGRAAESAFSAAGQDAFRGHDLAFYLERLRAATLGELARRNDRWLHEEYRPWGETPMNNLFCRFHVLEDEINHRGQIRVTRNALEQSG